MPNNDLISRTALLTAYDSAHKGPPGRARKLIEEAPTVDAAPVVHGRWVNQGFNPVCCSVCGVTPNALRGTTVQPDFKFCPYCGAKMDGDGE